MIAIVISLLWLASTSVLWWAIRRSARRVQQDRARLDAMQDLVGGWRHLQQTAQAALIARWESDDQNTAAARHDLAEAVAQVETLEIRLLPEAGTSEERGR